MTLVGLPLGPYHRHRCVPGSGNMLCEGYDRKSINKAITK